MDHLNVAQINRVFTLASILISHGLKTSCGETEDDNSTHYKLVIKIYKKVYEFMK